MIFLAFQLLNIFALALLKGDLLGITDLVRCVVESLQNALEVLALVVWSDLFILVFDKDTSCQLHVESVVYPAKNVSFLFSHFTVGFSYSVATGWLRVRIMVFLKDEVVKVVCLTTQVGDELFGDLLVGSVTILDDLLHDKLTDFFKAVLFLLVCALALNGLVQRHSKLRVEEVHFASLLFLGGRLVLRLSHLRNLLNFLWLDVMAGQRWVFLRLEGALVLLNWLEG